MFENSLPRRVEQRDHPMFHLPSYLWGMHPKMDIHQQNETDLSHPAVRKKENTVVNREKGSVLL